MGYYEDDIVEYINRMVNYSGSSCYEPSDGLDAWAYSNHWLYRFSRTLPKLPTQVFFNKKKKATTLLFNDKAYVVKCDKKDKYNKRIGFLEAYFQAHSGLSKTQANKYLRELVKKD